jgi:hypothetical protein
MNLAAEKRMGLTALARELPTWLAMTMLLGVVQETPAGTTPGTWMPLGHA